MDATTAASALLPLLALPFLAALVAPWIVRLTGPAGVWLLALVPAALFAVLATQIGTIAGGAVLTGGIDWIPSLGVRLSWRLDGLSLVFGLLISGIGTLIILYTGGYLGHHPRLPRFLGFMFAFMGSMLGLVMADDLFALLVLWEATSITSFLLIGFDHERRAARRAALQALVITGAGGLSLIAGFIVIGLTLDDFTMSGVLASGDALRTSPYYALAFWLVIGGAFTKSAQWPLHVWLPNAMEAPTPVSAYLHSATMVKAGVYLLMRLNPAMGGTELWETVLPLFGCVTLLAGTLLAVRQTDLKLMLAYTTVASLGLLVALTGFGTTRAIEAAVYYLFAHSLFKGCLFMVAGVIDHEAGTRDIRRLGGLMRLMPLTFAAALLAALSMGGLPPFVGFMAKEEIYYATAGEDARALAITAALVVGNALMLAIGFAVALNPFIGAARHDSEHPHEAPVLLLAGPVVLALAGLATALLAGATNAGLIGPMASAVAGVRLEPHAVPVPHLGVALALSALTVALGLLVWWSLSRGRVGMAIVLARLGWGPDRGFDQIVSGLLRLASAVTRTVQTGRLEDYVTLTFIAFAFAILAPMLAFGELPVLPTGLPPLRLHDWGVILIGLVGIVAVLIAADRLTAIVSLGIQGFAVALIFMLFGAPDLSFTQFMVETLSVVILALVMTRLTLDKGDHRPAGQRVLDSGVAIAGGLGFGLLLLKVTEVPFDARLSDFFAQYSYVIAHGRNIVNVIIVDFRGLDTLGEIAVVMVAGLAILSMIRIRVRPVADPLHVTPAGDALSGPAAAFGPVAIDGARDEPVRAARETAR